MRLSAVMGAKCFLFLGIHLEYCYSKLLAPRMLQYQYFPEQVVSYDVRNPEIISG
jgi:hypothetical protein